MLTVILRTCLRSKLDAGVDKQFVRICGEDRRAMVLKCLKSLQIAINRCPAKVKVIVLDDNSDEDFVNEIRLTLHDSEIVNLETPDGVASFNHSAYEQFRMASEVDGLVYSVEDDYLHDEDAIETMLMAYSHLSNRFPQDKVVVFPFDCPFRYETGREEPTVLLHDGSRYWRQVNHTTNTFLTKGKFIKEHFSVYAKLALEYPSVNESNTINKLYRSFFNMGGQLTVFNPIPSVAYHLSYAEPVAIKTDSLSWKSLWDSI
jgi:glycosyltransferase involved in cell wall biosynthesis